MMQDNGQRREKTMSFLDRFLIISVVLLTSVFPVELFPNTGPAPRGGDGQFTGKQGQVILINVPDIKDATSVKGGFLGRKLTLFPNPTSGGGAGYVGLLGIDLQDEPGAHELTVDVQMGEKMRHLSYQVLVLKEKFSVEHLTLPKDKVDLDEKAAARWKAEQEQVRKALAEESAMRLWQTGFIEPVHGKRTGIFGSVRIMNGQPRNPHNGEDIGAPMGTEVMASNDGVVRLVVDHIFSGRGIFVDHGLGLYSMYFHLSDVLVKEGDLIKAGQVIGKVGATGRATGPHLHWGMKVNGARVNPYTLLELPFSQNPAAVRPALAAPMVSPQTEPSPTAVGGDTR